jgi:hypothetical protein
MTAQLTTSQAGPNLDQEWTDGSSTAEWQSPIASELAETGSAGNQEPLGLLATWMQEERQRLDEYVREQLGQLTRQREELLAQQTALDHAFAEERREMGCQIQLLTSQADALNEREQQLAKREQSLACQADELRRREEELEQRVQSLEQSLVQREKDLARGWEEVSHAQGQLTILEQALVACRRIWERQEAKGIAPQPVREEDRPGSEDRPPNLACGPAPSEAAAQESTQSCPPECLGETASLEGELLAEDPEASVVTPLSPPAESVQVLLTPQAETSFENAPEALPSNDGSSVEEPEALVVPSTSVPAESVQATLTPQADVSFENAPQPLESMDESSSFESESSLLAGPLGEEDSTLLTVRAPAPPERQAQGTLRGNPVQVQLSGAGLATEPIPAWVVARSHQELQLMAHEPIAVGTDLEVRRVAPFNSKAHVEVKACRRENSWWALTCRFSQPLTWRELQQFS